MPAIDSPPRSSATPSGCISASRSDCVWLRSCWPPAALLLATKRCGSGRANLASKFANRIRRRLPRVGDKWHLDEVVLKIAGVKHWLWRAVDQTGIVLDVLVQRRRDKQAAKRLLRKLLKKQMRPPRVMITDKLASYGAAKREIMPGIEHRQHKGLEQHSGELAPTDAPTRAPNEAVQIGRPGAALPLSPRPDQQSLPPPPRSRHCCGAQSLQEPNVPGLGRNLQHGLAINLNPPIPIACIPLTDLTS
jgi:IS1 family transposase